VAKALATPTNWTAHGAVTPAKDQGSHGYCGTFGRVGAAEGQYALRSGLPLQQFAEEALVDCVGWDHVAEQQTFFQAHGFMPTALYPYNTTGPDSDPPVPGNPCKWDQSKAVARTSGGAFTDSTGGGPSEDQLAAFVYKNGPLQTGINANVFGLRAKGCEARGDCWITKDMCSRVSKQIDHSIVLVGYGTSAEQGDYWIVKNVSGGRSTLWTRPPRPRPSRPASRHPPPSPAELEHGLCQPGLYLCGTRRQLRGHQLLRKYLHLRGPCELLQ